MSQPFLKMTFIDTNQPTLNLNHVNGQDLYYGGKLCLAIVLAILRIME